MELVTYNLRFDAKSHVRRVVENGREYIVAKLKTIPLDGVLPGSQGALFYPARETINSVREWDGTPLVVYHPTRNNGEHCSAADVPEKHVGELRNSRIENDFLQHDGWFDVVNVKAQDKRVYDALLHRKPMELSTGLFTTNTPVPGGYATSPNGRPYQAVATRFRPDHLAILPDQVGACSINDGCGLHVNANPEGHNQYGSGTTHGKAFAASQKALGMSSKSFKARSSRAHEMSMRAHNASESGNHTLAADLHGKAENMHTSLGNRYDEDGRNENASDAHTLAASYHADAAAYHKNQLTGNANPEGINQYSHVTDGGANYHKAETSTHEYRVGQGTDGKYHAMAVRKGPNGKAFASSMTLEKLGAHATEAKAKAAVEKHAAKKNRMFVDQVTRKYIEPTDNVRNGDPDCPT